MTDYDHLLKIALRASIEAGQSIMSFYNSDFSIEYKHDNSPLTSADKASHNKIESILQQTKIPILSEEGKDIPFDIRQHWNSFWLIDPLDGTKEFIKRNGEFTVNIALIQNDSPVLGVIYVPVLNLLYWGSIKHGSRKLTDIQDLPIDDTGIERLISCSRAIPEKFDRPVVIMGSRSHQSIENLKLITDLSELFQKVEIINAGSSLKFCRLAEGAADIYPRLSPTMEWDTAAGHAICRFAGIKVFNYGTTEELKYNKKSLVNPWFIGVTSDFEAHITEQYNR